MPALENPATWKQRQMHGGLAERAAHAKVKSAAVNMMPWQEIWIGVASNWSSFQAKTGGGGYCRKCFGANETYRDAREILKTRDGSGRTGDHNEHG